MKETTGNKIRRLREDKGWTLDKLSKEAAVSKTSIWELEKDRQPKPAANSIKRIASTLGVSSDYLLGSTDDLSAITEQSDDLFIEKFLKLSPRTKGKIKEITKILIDED